MEEKKTLYDLKADEAYLITQEMILHTVESYLEHKRLDHNEIIVKPLILEI